MLIQYFDEIGGKQANGAFIAPQPPTPVVGITGIQSLNQVTFNEPQIAFRLPSPTIQRAHPARKAMRRKTGCDGGHTDAYNGPG